MDTAKIDEAAHAITSEYHQKTGNDGKGVPVRDRRRGAGRISRMTIFLPILAVLTLGLAGCGSSSTPPTSAQLNSAGYATQYVGADGHVVTKYTQAAKDQPKGWWKGDGVHGRASIVIDLSEQHALFYKGGELVGMSPVSTGREGYGTPSGDFHIIQKDENHLSTLYGDYVDDAGNTVVSNVGIEEDPRPPGTHFRGAPMPYYLRIVNGVGMHAGYLPGVPDSHGLASACRKTWRRFSTRIRRLARRSRSGTEARQPHD